MSNGLLYVAFGEQYDNLAAHCLAYSRKYTNLPITVLTNLSAAQRSKKWASAEGIDFKLIPAEQCENRAIKTTLIAHTPFEKTIYLDCDSIIQKPGIEKAFDLIEDDSLLLHVYARWLIDKQLTGLYRRAFVLAAASLPITIYYGAWLGFSKSEKTTEFFALWNRFWKSTGRGREMPALACAAAKSECKKIELSRKQDFFSWPIRGCIVQHEYGRHVRNLVGCPDFKAFKPFDRRAA